MIDNNIKGISQEPVKQIFEISETITTAALTGGLVVAGVCAIIYFYKKFSPSTGKGNSSESINNNDSIPSDAAPVSPSEDLDIIVNISESDEVLSISKQVSNSFDWIANYYITSNKGGLDKDYWSEFVKIVADSMDASDCNALEKPGNFCNGIEYYGTKFISCFVHGKDGKYEKFSIIDPLSLLKYWDSMFEGKVKTLSSVVTEFDTSVFKIPDNLRCFDILEEGHLRSVGEVEAILNMEGAVEYFSLYHASFFCKDIDNVEIIALFSAVLALTLYEIILRNKLPRKFYERGLSTVKDLQFLLKEFCIHDYFVLFKKSFLSIIFESSTASPDPDSSYSPKNDALSIIERVIFNKKNIKHFCKYRLLDEEIKDYSEENLSYASMVYWLDCNHSIANALNLSRPLYFNKGNFGMEKNIWKNCVFPNQSGSIAFEESLYLELLDPRKSAEFNQPKTFSDFWCDVTKKNLNIKKSDGKPSSRIGKKYDKQLGFSSLLLDFLYLFIIVYKKGYKLSHIRKRKL